MSTILQAPMVRILSSLALLLAQITLGSPLFPQETTDQNATKAQTESKGKQDFEKGKIVSYLKKSNGYSSDFDLPLSIQQDRAGENKFRLLDGTVIDALAYIVANANPPVRDWDLTVSTTKTGDWIAANLTAGDGGSMEMTFEVLQDSVIPTGLKFRGIAQDTEFLTVLLSEWLNYKVPFTETPEESLKYTMHSLKVLRSVKTE